MGETVVFIAVAVIVIGVAWRIIFRAAMRDPNDNNHSGFGPDGGAGG